MEWMTAGVNRPEHLRVNYGRQTWQRTSLVMMSHLSPNCTFVDASVCTHSRTDSKEDHFFAPTGNGSIVTTIFCADCGLQLSKSSEYFD
jgi:hypothetical protein